LHFTKKLYNCKISLYLVSFQKKGNSIIVNKKKTIDIFLSVIDNYGDIWFAVELLMAFKRWFGDVYEFLIWTDSLKKTEDFFSLNKQYLPKYSVFSMEDFGKMGKSQVALSLFHAPIPEKSYFFHKSLFLRIDYLSFDPQWLSFHEREHISSSENQKVIELIPSPLSLGAGLLPVLDTFYSRSFLAERFWLDEKKKWIPIFCYPETISRIHWTDVPRSFEFLIFGDTPLPESHSKRMDLEFHILPFLDIFTWQSILSESEWAILRWEVSASSGFSFGKLGFWDMYKQIGWYNSEQGNDFCNFFDFSPLYKDIHLRLNGQKEWWVYLSELIKYRENTKITSTRTKNLIEEIKKHIDRYEISI
jgi:hypothetical protein